MKNIDHEGTNLTATELQSEEEEIKVTRISILQ